MGCGSSSNHPSPTVSPTSTTTTTPSSTIVSKHALPLQTGTTAQSAALHALFLKHDKQLNNQLSATDLATLYIDMTMSKGSTSITQKDINAIMDFIDTDGSGGISRGEFLEWIESGFGKKASQLKKFGKQGHTESLLVDFLIGVITHVHGWLSSFQNLFRGNEDGITDSKLFGVLQQGMSTTGSFGNNNSVKTPPLKSILTFQNSSDSLIQPQDAIDFIAHMALHSKYRPHTVTQQQKQIYRTLLATIEAGMFEKKKQCKNRQFQPIGRTGLFGHVFHLRYFRRRCVGCRGIATHVECNLCGCRDGRTSFQRRVPRTPATVGRGQRWHVESRRIHQRRPVNDAQGGQRCATRQTGVVGQIRNFSRQFSSAIGTSTYHVASIA
jgi:hypothetical protein